MKQFYVYIHKKPDGTPCYVGKGHGKRAYWFYNRNPHHQAVLDKYADQIIVEVIHCVDEQAAFDLEKIYIKQLRLDGYRLCNQTDGGEGVTGHQHSQEARQAMSAAKVGKKQSLETIRKRAQKQIGRKMSQSFCDKLSVRHKGVAKSDEQRLKISTTLTGTKDTEERKANKSKAAIGKAKARNTSGLCGVSWCASKQSWEARMKCRDKTYRKRYKCLLDASAYIFYLQRLAISCTV